MKSSESDVVSPLSWEWTPDDGGCLKIYVETAKEAHPIIKAIESHDDLLEACNVASAMLPSNSIEYIKLQAAIAKATPQKEGAK